MKSLSRLVHRFLLIAMLVMTSHATLFAAPITDKPAEVEEKNYILPYTLVILATFLGVFVACKPGRRQSEPKMKRDFEETK